MAMLFGGVRLAMPLGRAPHAQRSKAKRQRHRAARLRTPAPERIVRTQAIGKRQPEPPAPTPARAPWLGTVVQVAGFVATVLGIVGSAFALNMSLRGFISDSITVFKSEQATSITVLKGDLTASSRELAASITTLKGEQAASTRELAASITVLKNELTANTASSREVNAKLDSFSATVQAQQIETAKLQGLVSGLQEGGKKK